MKSGAHPAPAELVELLPCPFCRGTNTELRDKSMWTGMRSQLINVELHHWCEAQQGKRGHIQLAAPTREQVAKDWNTRASLAAHGRVEVTDAWLEKTVAAIGEAWDAGTVEGLDGYVGSVAAATFALRAALTAALEKTP